MSVVVEIEPIVTAHVPLLELYLHRGSPLKRMRCPCLAFVLRHPTAGVVLVDTGLGAGFDRKLLDRGIEPAGVETVLMTHLHVDHTGGMGLLANARFWIGRREWKAATAGLAVAKGYIGRHLPPADRVEMVDGEVDVLGDGSVRLLPTPGHTPGHNSVLVRTGTGDVLLAGDAAYTLRNVREQSLPLINANADAYLRSLALLKELDDAGVPVVPSHDPDAYRSL